MSSSRSRQLLLLPLAALLLGTGLSIVLSIRAGNDERERIQESLRRAATPVAASIQRVLDRHVEVVQSVAGLFRASDRVTREEFREFTRGPLALHPSIQALEWIPRVRHSDRAAFEREVRVEGLPGFALHEISADGRLEPASDREEYFPVTFLEPREGNEPALGFDLASESFRREALLEAMTAATSVASAAIRLVQEAGEKPAILLFHPVYVGRQVPDDPEERRASLEGFALGVFHIEDLMADALRAAPLDGLRVRLLDESHPASPALLHPTAGISDGSPDTTPRWSAPLSLPGRRWMVVFTPTRGEALGHEHFMPPAWQVFVASLALTLLVAASLLALIRRSLRIEALARELERANRGLEEENAERRRAEESLRESEERFREMADHVEGVFWLFDWAERRVIYASPAFERIWGRSVEDLYADRAVWDESILAEDREEARASFARVIEVGGGEPREYRIVRSDGEVRWISDLAFPVPDPSGRIVRIAGIAEDITDRKDREEEHRLLQTKMQHAQKLESLGVLAGGIAHDFNNLLMSIMGNADLAQLDLASESPSRRHVQKIEQAAKRAAELTNQLLAYSGKGRFVIQAIHVNRVVEEMGHLLQTVVSKKASLELDLAPDLPAVEADPSQIRQVVMNLITNASEALAEGSGTVRVSTGSVDADRTYLAQGILGGGLEAGRYVWLDVSDTGSGMDAETRRNIFDPFFTTKFTGRGLGLAAVLGIVKGHAGTILVDSEPGRGTRIRVLFPASTETPPPERAEGQATRRERSGATILIVDDDPGVRDVAGTMLENAGFRILTATDGLSGVETFRQHQDEVDLVLLDMTMPGMDGEEAFREMRRISREVRVILSSGYSEQDATTRFVGMGLAGFIQKPYRTGLLLDRIDEALEGGPDGATD